MVLKEKEKNKVAILTMYIIQKKQHPWQNWLNNCSYKGVEVKTIDGFQGREKEILLVSMVRSNPEHEIGFLKDSRRWNVAVTRAKRLLVVVGDVSTFLKEETFKSFFEYMKLNGDIRIFGRKM